MFEDASCKVARTKDGRTMFSSKCAVCDSKNSKFIKVQQASGSLSSLGISRSLISLVGPFFLIVLNEWNSKQIFIGRR